MANRFATMYQWGLETTSGNAVAADSRILGAAIQPIETDRVPIFHEDNVGVRARSTRVSFGNYLFKHPINIQHGYFQILPMLFSCGLKGSVTPSEQTGGAGDYLWTHSPGLTGSNSLDSITLELGDDTQAYEAEYGQFGRIVLSGVIAQGAEHSTVSINSDFYGRQLSPVSFTNSIAVPTVTPINAKLSRIYIDTTWGSLGSSEKTNLLRTWELEILTGAHPKFLGSAYNYFATHGQGYIDAMLTLTLERGATSDTEWDTFRAGTEQAIRIEIDSGVAIGTGGNHKLTLDLWGAYEYVTPISSEEQSNNVDVALFHGMYDDTAIDLLDVNLITNVSAI